MNPLQPTVAAAIAALVVIMVVSVPGVPQPPQRTHAATAMPATKPARTDAPSSDAPQPASRRLVEGGSSLQQRVEHLLSTGAPRDRYLAFAMLARCARAIDFDRYLMSLPASSEATRARERYGDGAARIATACGDLPAALVAQRVELVAAAADDDIPGAASAWIEEGPYGDRTALTQRPDDPLVVQWAQQAIARVHAATRRSDTEAIGQFGMLCLNWEMDDVARVRLLVDAALERRREDDLKAVLN